MNKLCLALSAFMLLFLGITACRNQSTAPNGATALPPLIPKKVLFGNPDKTLAKISPDGKLIAYLAPNNGIMSIWIRTIGQQDDHVITNNTGNINAFPGYIWQADSKHIIYSQDKDGDENWHIYQVALDTKVSRNLTPFENTTAYLLPNNPTNYEHPNELLVLINVKNPALHDVYRINLQTGEAVLDTPNPGDVQAFSWFADNNLQVRATKTYLPDGGQETLIRDDAQSPWRSFQKWAFDDSLDFFTGFVAFTPDNKKGWLLATAGTDRIQLREYDLQTGESKLLAEDPQYDIAAPLINPITYQLEAVNILRERSDWIVIDPEVKNDFEALSKIANGDFRIESRDKDNQKWLVTYEFDNGPNAFYLYNREKKTAEPLFTSNSALAKYQMANVKPVSFTARDGLKVHGYLTLPPNVKPEKLPLVVVVHGGPWARDIWYFDPEIQWFANRGYAALQINFRGSAGYGKQFLNAGNREWGGKMQDDLTDGKNWAIAQGIADPQRVAIFGGSYGGYAVLAGLTFTPNEFACGVDMFGISNLQTFLDSIPPYWETFRSVLDNRLGRPTETEYLKSRSPITKIDQIKVPLLIAQGGNDPRVKKAESEQMVAALKQAGKGVEYIYFPDEGHGFVKPENKMKFYDAVEKFLAQHLGGRTETTP